MNTIEIPLLRNAATYARRLTQACRQFTEIKYHLHRRINWSYRYSEKFYSNESNLFKQNPDAYIRCEVNEEPKLDDVYSIRLDRKQTIKVVLKVLAHTLFAMCGRIFETKAQQVKFSIYRKSYVDDIELVFEQEQEGVIRAVYPFPINIQRQWRYIRFLIEKGYKFKLAGNPYILRDFARFLRFRDVHSLMRMESRAQIRHARSIAGFGVHIVQLSDEFDIGSLDFSRALARYGIDVANSAHGVGTYLPVHAYKTFFVITKRQKEYYMATRPCKYLLRQLNDRIAAKCSTPQDNGNNLVFLSQSFGGGENLINYNENIVLQRIQKELSMLPNLRLHYKPHPNRENPNIPAGFNMLKEIESVNGGAGTVYISLYSTCQIDPKFKGQKFLIRGHLIYPEICFDNTDEIISLDNLISMMKSISAVEVIDRA